MYVAHNFQFLAYSTAMEGRKAETLSAMTQLQSEFPEDAMLAMPGTDWYGSERYLAIVRFGLWDEILAEPAPNPSLKALQEATCMPESRHLPHEDESPKPGKHARNSKGLGHRCRRMPQPVSIGRPTCWRWRRHWHPHNCRSRNTRTAMRCHADGGSSAGRQTFL